MFNRHEMVDIVTIDGKARGIIVKDLIHGTFHRFFAHAVVLPQRIWKCLLLVYKCDGK